MAMKGLSGYLRLTPPKGGQHRKLWTRESQIAVQHIRYPGYLGLRNSARYLKAGRVIEDGTGHFTSSNGTSSWRGDKGVNK